MDFKSMQPHMLTRKSEWRLVFKIIK